MTEMNRGGTCPVQTATRSRVGAGRTRFQVTVAGLRTDLPRPQFQGSWLTPWASKRQAHTSLGCSEFSRLLMSRLFSTDECLV